jgi:hypothetical protein
MREKDWSRSFDDPIDLPRGRTLVTLEDAGNYITKLPKAEHAAPEWQDAMEALFLVATRGWPTMLARIGVMKALNRHVVREFNSDRKDCNHVDVAPSEAFSRRSRPGRLSRPLAPEIPASSKNSRRASRGAPLGPAPNMPATATINTRGKSL